MKTTSHISFLLFAITCILLAVGAEVNAAPALRGCFSVKQSDGTMLTIEQFGDEFHHWTATTDGTIVIATEKGYCVARRICAVESKIFCWVSPLTENHSVYATLAWVALSPC